MVELRFLIVVLRYLGVDWDCLKISYDLKKNLKIDFHHGTFLNYTDSQKSQSFCTWINFKFSDSAT